MPDGDEDEDDDNDDVWSQCVSQMLANPNTTKPTNPTTTTTIRTCSVSICCPARSLN